MKDGRRKPTKAVCVCYHGDTVLLQRGGVDDLPQQTAVSDSVLLAFETLVLQLTVDQQQLTPQRLKLLPLGGA